MRSDPRVPSRWSIALAVVGVVAGAVFAVCDEARHLLAPCEAYGQDWYARLLILVLLFGMHGLALSAGAYAVLEFSLFGKGVVRRLVEIAVVVVIAMAVGFCMAIADPVLHHLLSASCAALGACGQPGFAQSLLHGATVAASWPNTPVAVLMVTLFCMGSFLVQEVAVRERNAAAAGESDRQVS